MFIPLTSGGGRHRTASYHRTATCNYISIMPKQSRSKSAAKPASAYQQREAALRAALAIGRAQEKPIWKDIARETGVNYYTLCRRVKGGKSRLDNQPVNKRLDTAMEAALVGYVTNCDKLGIAPSLPMLRNAAQFILKEAEPDAPPLGEHWLRRFMERRSELFRKKQRRQELDRVMQHDKVMILGWFERLKKVRIENGVDPGDIWNMDEVGYRIGVGDDRAIATTQPNRIHYIPSDTNRESATGVEAINTRGMVIPPLFIMTGQVIMSSWFDNDLHNSTLITATEKGYIDDTTALAWIEHFNRYTHKSRIGKYRLLILDNQVCHCTFEVLDYASKHDILIFAIPAHTSHFLQPLDLTCFSPLKQYHRDAVNAAFDRGVDFYSKAEFLADITNVRTRAFKDQTIKNGFKEAGIHPFDPSRVLDRLPDIVIAPEQVESDLDTEIDESDLSPLWDPKTPQNPRHWRSISQTWSAGGSPVNAEEFVGRLLKGGESMAHQLKIARREQDHNSAAATRRAKRANNRKRAANGGLMTAELGRKIEAEKMKVAAMKAEAQKKQAEARAVRLARAERAVQVANRALHAAQQGAVEAYLDEEDATSEEGEEFDLFP